MPHPASDDDPVVLFHDPDDLPPGRRLSTWTSTQPSERGPEPRPTWVVVSGSAVDTELGILKTGKEADVHLLERAVPGDPAAASMLAAKRYRSAERSDFHRSAQYREGRRLRRSRDARAVAKGSSYGRGVAAGAWARAEFEALSRLWSLEVAVPYPVQVQGTELLMEYIGDERGAAPRLAQLRADAALLDEYFEQVRALVLALAREGFAHGDLSPYNLLVQDDRVVMIDLPQLVDIVANPSGLLLAERDCRNVCDWFGRRGLDRDASDLMAEVVGALW